LKEKSKSIISPTKKQFKCKNKNKKALREKLNKNNFEFGKCNKTAITTITIIRVYETCNQFEDRVDVLGRRIRR